MLKVDNDELFHNFYHHASDLLHAATIDDSPHIPVIVENWRAILAALFTSHDILDLISAGGNLVHLLKQLDTFFVHVARLISAVKVIIVDAPPKVYPPV